MTQSLALDGLTPARARVLWELRAHGPMLQRALAETFRIAPRTVTGLIDGLVATGFVTREPHPTDRRAALVTMTEQGAATVAAMERDQGQFLDILFGGMPADRLASLLDGIEDILARLRSHGVDLPETTAG